jgi:hypothetical protein
MHRAGIADLSIAADSRLTRWSLKEREVLSDNYSRDPRHHAIDGALC